MRIDEIKYIKGRKSIGIQIKDGRVCISAPRGISDSKLQSVLRDKEKWIDKKLAEYDSVTELNRDIIEYKRFLYLGEKYDPKKILKPVDLKKIEKEYKKRAAAFLPELLYKASAESGIKYNSLKLTRSKAKWGSCNSKGVIALNWRLIMLPQTIIEYICLHELCHLKNMDHSKKYWQTLEKYYPAVKSAKQYLKSNNYIIKLF